MISFSTLSMRAELTRAVTEMGFETPTPIQQLVIPHLISSPADIIGLAQTGTGKTAAFGLPLLHHTDVSVKHVQGLILSPTRELCMQIQVELAKYGQYMPGLRTCAVYGGVPITNQIREVRTNPQIIVATPGRLIDLLERKAISLDHVEYVVLDEADEMLNMGFREDIDFILGTTPMRKYTWLFSATMSNEVRGIAKRFMTKWEEFSVAAANATNENIDHQYYVTQHRNRFETLQRLLDFTPGIYGIIFTRTRQDCQDISEKLMKQGYHVSPLHGDMDQKMRSKVLERFKNRTLQAIVATDVAARGIDVNDITHVINYELPDDPEVYTHRSGRTARAGKSGICISIVSPKEVGSIRTIERIVKNKFNKCDIPDGAEIVRKRLFHFLEQIENVQPESEFADVYLNMIHEKFETMEKDDLIKRLIFLQLQETIQTYQKSHDLNALSGGDAKNAGVAVRGAVWTRMFLNIGQKDGFNEASLTQFICDQTDLKPDVLDRVTVRDLSSFYNVKTDVVDLIIESISSKKFKGRKLRTEEADKKDASRGPSRGGYGGGRPGGDRNGGGRSYGGGDRGGRGYGGDRGNSERSGGGRSYGGDRSGGGERGGYFKSRDEKAGRSSSAGRGDSYRGGGRNRD